MSKLAYLRAFYFIERYYWHEASYDNAWRDISDGFTTGGIMQ